MQNDNKINFIKRVREDLIRYKLYNDSSLSSEERTFLCSEIGLKSGGRDLGIPYLPTSKEYEKEFHISEKTLSRWTNNGLSVEEQKYRKEAVQKAKRDFFIRLPKEKQEERRKQYGELMKKCQKKGKVSEEIVKRALEMRGWKVMKFFVFEDSEDYNKSRLIKKLNKIKSKLFKKEEFLVSILDVRGIEKLLKGRTEDCERLITVLKEIIGNPLKTYCSFLPDFLARKGDAIRIIEVKNLKEFNPDEIGQRYSIDYLRKEGFTVDLINLPLSGELTKEDIEKQAKSLEL